MSEPLDTAQIAELHADLRALETALADSLRVSTDQAAPVELDQSAVGRVSRIDAIQQQQMAAAQSRRAEQRLKIVRVALQIFDEDEYGWCRKCGDPIGYRRLKARPESPCCIPCTQKLERG